MKRINLTLIVILFTSFVYAQNDYYWSTGKKHYLKQQANAFVVKLHKELTFESAQKIKSDRNLKEVTRMKRNLGIAIANDTLVNAKKLKEYVEFLNAMPVYQSGDLPFFLTGEILMQPKNNASVEDILKLVNNKVSVKNRTKYNTYILETEDWDKLLGYANLIYESGLVEYCHPNFIAPRKKHQINDPQYSEQYYLNNTGQFGGTAGIDINAPEAWGIITGNSPITVAVIDDGVEAHEDLGDRVLQGFTPQFSLQNPDTQGAPNQNDPPGSHVGHGQCCAGIIGATHNSLGIRGLAPEVDIVPINIFNDWFTYLGEVYYSEDIQDIVAAIDFAWDDAGADVISNSWNFVDPGADFEAITQAIGRARIQGRTLGTNHLGCVVVFASGNDANPYDHLTVRFPANVDGVITVGAVDKNGNIWNYSCRGNSMDLVAPSGALDLNGDVRTIDREGSDGYETGNYTDGFGGTSAACPQVAGIAALLLSVNPSLTEAEVRTTLQQTATDMGTSGFDNTYGYGRVNAYAAVNAVAPRITGPATICGQGTYTIENLPQGATVQWSASNCNIELLSGQGTDTAVYRTTGVYNSEVQASIIFNSETIGTLTQPVSICQPYISGPSSFCSSSATYTLNNLPYGASVMSWSSSNPNVLSLDPFWRTSATFSKSGDGKCSVMATIRVCGTTVLIPAKQVNVGIPSFPYLYDGTTTSTTTTPHYITCYGQPTTVILLTVQDPSSSATSQGLNVLKTAYPGNFDLTVNGRLITVIPRSEGSGQFEVRTYNQCGESQPVIVHLTFERCGSGGVDPPSWPTDFSLSPNPTTGETTLTIEPSSAEKTFDATAQWDLEVYSETQLLKTKQTGLRGRSVKIQTAGWKEGVYIVRVKYKDEILTGKLVVKK